MIVGLIWYGYPKITPTQQRRAVKDIVTELEQNQFSAMPVVDDGKVLGMVSSDLLAQRYLLRLLRSQVQAG